MCIGLYNIRVIQRGFYYIVCQGKREDKSLKNYTVTKNDDQKFIDTD